MNRKERRKMMRECGIRTREERDQFNALCGGISSGFANEAIDGLEAAFRKKWNKKDDETMNEGGGGSEEDGGDEIYNN